MDIFGNQVWKYRKYKKSTTIPLTPEDVGSMPLVACCLTGPDTGTSCLTGLDIDTVPAGG